MFFFLLRRQLYVWAGLAKLVSRYISSFFSFLNFQNTSVLLRDIRFNTNCYNSFKLIKNTILELGPNLGWRD